MYDLTDNLNQGGVSLGRKSNHPKRAKVHYDARGFAGLALTKYSRNAAADGVKLRHGGHHTALVQGVTARRDALLTLSKGQNKMKDEIYNFLEALAATAIIAALVWLCMIATPCQMSGEYDLALEEMRQAQ